MGSQLNRINHVAALEPQAKAWFFETTFSPAQDGSHV
jgi:hypothetical protein